MTRRKNAELLVLRLPERVERSIRLVIATSAKADELHALDVRDPRTQCWASQDTMRASARFAASLNAWKRRAAWATEDRLEADARRFAETVERVYAGVPSDLVSRLAESRGAK